MGLISHGIAVGIGYYIAQPSGQRRLTQLRERVVGLAHSPQVTQLQEHGRGLVGDRALARPATTGRHAKADLTTSDLTTSDVVTDDLTTTDTAGGEPAVAPSVPATGRRLRRQRARENRPPRPSSAAATSSPTPDPLGDRAR